MRTKLPILLLLMGLLLLSEVLRAQEYLDLWHNAETDNFYLIQQKFNEYFAGRDKGRGSGYVQFKRWEYFMAPRVYPSGKLINPARLALDEELRYQGSRSFTMRRTAHAGDWHSLGIKNYSSRTRSGMGRVNCIVPHPTDPQTLFIGTPAGGIWKTTDGGNNWIPLSDGLPVIGISGIAINPVYPDSIYILTGDGDGRNTNSIGVLLSTNGGDTWQSTGLQFNYTVPTRGYKLIMHPIDHNILFAATTRGIYKTTDRGVSWRLTVSGLFTDLAFKPSDPSTVYAARTDRFYKSVNNGENWTVTVNIGLPSFGISDRIAIGVTPGKPDYVYLLYGAPKNAPNPGFVGLYRSENGGKTFERRSNSPNILGYLLRAPFDTDSQSAYDLAIAISPDNGEEVHIGGINCWKSTDGGQSWNYTSDWDREHAPDGKYTHGDIHALVFNGSKLYCGSDGGIYGFSNTSDSWIDLSYGLEITQFYRIGTPASNLDIIYGGAQDNGIHKWIASNPGIMELQQNGDGGECIVDYTNENKVYAFIQNGEKLFVTSNGGASSWRPYNQPAGANGNFIVPLIMDAADNNTLYAGYDAVYKISVGWLSITFTPISSSSGVYCNALGVSAANPDYLYAVRDETIELTQNASSGHVWENIRGSLPAGIKITDIVVSPLDATKAWISVSGYSEGNKVFQISDAGSPGSNNTWINISGTLPNVPVNCIAHHNNGKDGIYIGTDIGVFYHDNTMTDWIPFRNGMPNVIVYDLKITNDKIRAATHGRGIWESDLYGNCSEDFLLLSGDVTGFQFLESGDGILSTVNIKGGIGTSVQYKTAGSILLSPGFRVVSQSSFLASIGDCNNSAPANRPSGNNRRYRGIYEGPMSGALGIASITDSVSVSLPDNRLKIYPNPFKEQSTVEFYIAKPTPTTISLWDLTGKRIKILFESRHQSPGNYQLRLNTAALSSGTYFVRLQTETYQQTKKIIIIQ